MKYPALLTGVMGLILIRLMHRERRRVHSLIEPNSEALVLVQADTGVDHGQVVAVMDRLREIPGAKLAIATK